MHKILASTALAAVLASACAPAGRPVAEPAPRDTITRPLLRPVPMAQGYRRALEAGTRSATGQPGPRYWQQSVSYRIQAELDPQSATLRGTERIVYRNRSPETLSTVVLNLYQNIFTETARRNRVIVAPTGGVTLGRVAVEGRELRPVAAGRIGVGTPVRTPEAGYEVQGTLARLTLPRPVAPGDSTTLEIEWSHRIPPAGTFRTAYEDALGGRAFNVAQWYPQVAVLDDVIGWDATPYLGDGEFYLEYGDFDVSITLPAGHLVGATGVLQNPGDVLTPEAAARLARAATTDSTVRVVTEAERAAGRATRTGARLTWRFRAENVRDFAFATSDRYLWDATRATIPGAGGERTVMIHSLYRAGAPHWQEAARFGQHSIGFFSDRLVPYAYPQATIAEGPISGMEYPMLVFIHRAAQREDLYSVIAHELGHEWFPMMIGQDEASFAWMDEGLTTYFEDEAREAFFPGARAHEETRAAYLRVAGRDNEVPLMRHTDLVSPYGARTVAAYSKPGTLMVTLRDVLGAETFDRAMRTYAQEWMFKHPYPWDFFNTFERVAGRDLDWFFYPWWFETGTLDFAVGPVRAVSGGVEVTLTDLGGIPAPVRVTATGEGGTSASVDIPLESWTGARTRTATFTLPLSSAPTRVEVDPQGALPDVNRANNVWQAP
ncbi:MAG TPA: M1 family metallopeptidase [Longimicrobium sp.]